jgi:hypothetical protein
VKTAAQRWVGGAALSAVLAVILAVALLPRVSPLALTLGWGVALLNALLARVIHHRAVGAPSQDFIVWGIAGNVLRMAGVLGIFAAVIYGQRLARDAFFVGVFTGVFVFMAIELAGLYRSQGAAGKTT